MHLAVQCCGIIVILAFRMESIPQRKMDSITPDALLGTTECGDTCPSMCGWMQEIPSSTALVHIVTLVLATGMSLFHTGARLLLGVCSSFPVGQVVLKRIFCLNEVGPRYDTRPAVHPPLPVHVRCTGNGGS